MYENEKTENLLNSPPENREPNFPPPPDWQQPPMPISPPPRRKNFLIWYLVIGLIVAIIFISIAGWFIVSKTSPANKIKGVWANHGNDSTLFFEFGDDSVVKMAFVDDDGSKTEPISGTYTVDGDQLSMNWDLETMNKVKATFSISNDILTFDTMTIYDSDGLPDSLSDLEFTRVDATTINEGMSKYRYSEVY